MNNPEVVDAAAAALERVRLAARQAGYQPGEGVGRTKLVHRNQPAQRHFKTNQQPDDLSSLTEVFSRFIAQRGWREPVAVGSVTSRWDQIVGPEIAEHTAVEDYENSEIVIRCSSTAWATQLKLLSGQLQQRFDTLLGSGVITKIIIRGPAQPSWKKGPRVVKGRGPRDTYG